MKIAKPHVEIVSQINSTDVLQRIEQAGRVCYKSEDKITEDKILHFYVDDYQFERVWNDPDRYIPLLRKFKAVLATQRGGGKDG